jgi:hypothetical protein
MSWRFLRSIEITFMPLQPASALDSPSRGTLATAQHHDDRSRVSQSRAQHRDIVHIIHRNCLRKLTVGQLLSQLAGTIL